MLTLMLGMDIMVVDTMAGDIHTDTVTTTERGLLMPMKPQPLDQTLMLKLIPTTMDTTDMDIGDIHTDTDTGMERDLLMLMKPQLQVQTLMLLLMLMLGMDMPDTTATDTGDIHTDT